ncbi:AlpA family phage regulatory protein [Zobellella taiwanensis]|uniref:AlpA family phage regulatory protein n=1 Tax=Zobellella taiwanensis TaxID=347535 RepID=A0A2P7R582_9GAMM|nr:AlpA family phage regulatory protein [Zobellella taiwanensis]PSJ45379.1 AlpA family phage regulatory protein [Zobellella taiwanensis]
MDAIHQDRLLNVKQVQALVPASRVSIWRWEKAGKFPKSVKLGGTTRWRESDIQKWISGLKAA